MNIMKPSLQALFLHEQCSMWLAQAVAWQPYTPSVHVLRSYIKACLLSFNLNAWLLVAPLSYDLHNQH